jgi:hypothetical protein
MRVADNIRRALHHLGIHSCTIQPEYTPSGVSVDSKVRYRFLYWLNEMTEYMGSSGLMKHLASFSAPRIKHATHLKMRVVVR